MPWGKMDDKFHRNAKVRALRRAKGGREALGVWTFWWSWCLDDPDLTGLVPEDELPAPDARAAALLVEVGLWDRVDGGYQFHDFAEYNPRREQVDAKRDADRLRLAVKRAASRMDVARDTYATSLATNNDVASTRDPVPSRPVPFPTDPPNPLLAGWGASGVFAEIEPEFSKRRSESGLGTYRRLPSEYALTEHVAAWAEAEPEGAQSAILRSLDGFFADAFQRKCGFKFKTWASDPGAFLGLKAKARGPAPPASHEEFADDPVETYEPKVVSNA